jgi:hypothetical protein
MQTQAKIYIGNKRTHYTHMRAIQDLLDREPSTFIWQMATPIIVSWFAGRTWKITSGISNHLNLCEIFVIYTHLFQWAELLSRYSDWLQTGRSGDRIPGRREFPLLFRPALGPIQPPEQWVPGLSLGVESGRDMTLTPHPLLVPRSKNRVAMPLLSLRAFMACRKSES